MLTLHSPARPGSAYIRAMFDSFARRYDIFSWLIGMGQAGRMRREALRHAKPGLHVLDLASGTGDLAVEAARRTGPGGSVTALDFSAPMLDSARRKFERRIPPPMRSGFETVHRSAEELPLEGRTFDLIVSGYALRNMYENIEHILQGVRDSLAPGGRIAFLDLTEPAGPVRRFLFRGYLYLFVGLYGVLLFGKKYPVSYLPDSAGRFFRAGEFADFLRRAGFSDVTARPFMLGAVTLYEASRP